jgi:hypothetical protein
MTSLNEVQWSEAEAKGFLPATISDGEQEVAVVFYDPTRLAQDVRAEVEISQRFASPSIVVLPSITRAAVEAAAESLAASGFRSVTRW